MGRSRAGGSPLLLQRVWYPEPRSRAALRRELEGLLVQARPGLLFSSACPPEIGLSSGGRPVSLEVGLSAQGSAIFPEASLSPQGSSCLPGVGLSPQGLACPPGVGLSPQRSALSPEVSLSSRGRPPHEARAPCPGERGEHQNETGFPPPGPESPSLLRCMVTPRAGMQAWSPSVMLRADPDPAQARAGRGPECFYARPP